MKVQWTDRAKARLHAIQQHIAKDSPQSARSEVEKILRRSWQLASPPEIGHPVPGYDETELREVLIKPYRLIYCLREKQIDVITVLHYRQLLPSDLESLHR